MSTAFDTINIHTVIRKLLQTNIPGTIINLMANYIKGCKAYTTYINHTPIKRQFKTGVPNVSSSHPRNLIFTMQTYYHWFRSWPMRMTSPSHLHPEAAVKQINTLDTHTVLFKFNDNGDVDSNLTVCAYFAYSDIYPCLVQWI